MAFNIHITRIDANPASGEFSAKAEKTNQGHAARKNQHADQSLIHVPADRLMNKYPVRIFELQTQE
ncbi:MAG: hypothetical protein ABI690_25980 [Chloroflexota bacterium]